MLYWMAFSVFLCTLSISFFAKEDVIAGTLADTTAEAIEIGTFTSTRYFPPNTPQNTWISSAV